MNDRTTHMALVAEHEQRQSEKAEWLRILAANPQPHHNTQCRDLESFTERQRQRMKAAGWLKQKGEALLDVLLAVAIGVSLAALLFYGLSS